MKILLPKMDYKPEERAEVIQQAYLGLFRLAAPMLFDKYVDFIDVYAKIRDEEREAIYCSVKVVMPGKTTPPCPPQGGNQRGGTLRNKVDRVRPPDDGERGDRHVGSIHKG
ncbi:hypothetical protein DAMNIGENAA_38780 [Desulforhabdus amnigena]|uniref:Uncharacterized protein n=2 Tax=Desulforhabdus amnigena TaxID=40218 RepID=A0A9W6FX27_9BACT|nr:hypothetical protein DAMNIGENAA_38780 [Desulforhabdus amnigena]